MPEWTNDTATWRDRRGYDLSDRIWSNLGDLRRLIEDILHDAITSGQTVEQLEDRLVRFISPDYARSGEGKARYAANRLASHEMRRAHTLAVRDTVLIDPAGARYLRFRLDPTHSVIDQCDPLANHDEGFGRGVYPARNCPLPPIHVKCRCHIDALGDYGDMDTVVDALRVEYDLGDPPDLSPAELVIFRQETAAIREAVLVSFGAWFEQTGIVSQQQLLSDSPTVKGWVDEVKAAKQRRKERT